jgi:hypothetical protein
MQTKTTAVKSFYVKRVSPEGRLGWTGSIRSERQAHREAQAWRDSDWIAEVLPNTPTIRAEVRSWQRERNAAR